MGSRPPIVVVDYGLGNIFSVLRALERLGVRARVSADPKAVAAAPRIIIPGVGSFGDGMRGLEENGLVEPLREAAAGGRPILGICLGMQLLMEEGVEFGRRKGLGIIRGRTKALRRRPGVKVPHVGWNRLEPPAPEAPSAKSAWDGTILKGLGAAPHVYFVHSYAVAPKNHSDWLAQTDYGGSVFCSALRSGCVSGCQFHPEKSGPVGLRILANFLEA